MVKRLYFGKDPMGVIRKLQRDCTGQIAKSDDDGVKPIVYLDESRTRTVAPQLLNRLPEENFRLVHAVRVRCKETGKDQDFCVVEVPASLRHDQENLALCSAELLQPQSARHLQLILCKPTILVQPLNHHIEAGREWYATEATA